MNGTLAPGTRIAHFEIAGVLGRGATATVYEARSPAGGPSVALKILRDESPADPSFARLVGREARRQAAVEHPHVVTVLDAGTSEFGPWIAMELVRGGSLADRLGDGALPPAVALPLLRQVADALDAAHRAGLVHRDVKPHNVLVADSGHAYLSDFGAARLPLELAHTIRSGIVGTLGYVAPEVIRGASATAAADIYAFAAMSYECLAGRPPFGYEEPAALLFAHASEPPPPLGGGAPAAASSVLARGLAKAPEHRPAAARELVDALAAALAEPAVRRRRPVAGLSALSALAAAAALALVLAGGAERSRPSAPAAAVRASTGVTLGALGAAAGPPIRCPDTPRDCTVAAWRLPGARLRATREGVIDRWSVADARGQFALAVLSESDGEIHQLARSAGVFVAAPGVHSFATRLTINPGDSIAVELIGGARLGVAASRGAARLAVWRRPVTGTPVSIGAGRRVLRGAPQLQADVEVGARPAGPRELTGPAAARAPTGRRLRRRPVRFSDGRRAVVALVALATGVAVDESRHGRRVARVALTGDLPGGHATAFRLDHSPTDPDEVGVWVQYVNPDSDRLVDHYFLIHPDRITSVD